MVPMDPKGRMDRMVPAVRPVPMVPSVPMARSGRKDQMVLAVPHLAGYAGMASGSSRAGWSSRSGGADLRERLERRPKRNGRYEDQDEA